MAKPGGTGQSAIVRNMQKKKNKQTNKQGKKQTNKQKQKQIKSRQC